MRYFRYSLLSAVIFAIVMLANECRANKPRTILVPPTPTYAEQVECDTACAYQLYQLQLQLEALNTPMP